MENMDTEMKVFEFIKQESEKPRKFILINPYEIDLLKGNWIKINGIEFHHYKSWNLYDEYRGLIKKYNENKYEGDIYLLGMGPISKYVLNDLNDENVHIEINFNSLKYLSKYPTEIITKTDNNDKIQTNNELFIETLKNNYMNCLFHCNYNTGIIGIEGYHKFHDTNYKFLESVETIYIINNKKYYSDFNKKILELGYKDKIKYLEINVGELFKSNPELIAYYRIEYNTERDNYLDLYYNFDYVATITDQISIGNDFYKRINYYKNNDCYFDSYNKLVKLFPNNITHVINVSDEKISLDEMPDESIIYDYFPINESETDDNVTKIPLFCAAERIHEIISVNKNNKIYIHCAVGANRSPAVVILYLIKYCNMSLYDAYKLISKKRHIYTSISLFNIIYNESKQTNDNVISPLKIRTNYGYNVWNYSSYLFALYDVIYLEKLYNENTN